MRWPVPAAATVLLVLLVGAMPGAAAVKPDDVNVVNTPANPVPVTTTDPVTVQGPGGGAVATSITNTPTVNPVPEHYQANGGLDSSSCSASVVGGVPEGRTVVITDVDVGSEDLVKPEVIIWTRQRTGGGFFTHFRGIPLTTFPEEELHSGSLQMNHRIVPGSTTSGDLSDMFLCMEPGAGDAFASATYIVSGYLE